MLYFFITLLLEGKLVSTLLSVMYEEMFGFDVNELNAELSS